MYNGSSLSQMTVVTETTENGATTTETEILDFTYDASGSPQTVTYDDTTYYYSTNLQGDVVAILNSAGTAVVSYTYNAWGEILTIEGSLASTLGAANPLTYRGYVFDTETEAYYLQSRYYNPAIGRFINADAYTATGQGLLGNNMFAYCLNNPVSYSDVTGTAAKTCISADGRIYDTPWKDSNTGDKSYNLSSVRSFWSYSAKRLDITDRLNEAMMQHAEELHFYQMSYGGNSAALYFAFMVRPGGSWDLKSKNSWHLIRSMVYVYSGREFLYDDIGNIHYGFVGRVLFSKETLLLAGGLVQIVSGTSSLAFASSYFDDPRDQVAISFGSALWEGGL